MRGDDGGGERAEGKGEREGQRKKYNNIEKKRNRESVREGKR